MRTSEPKDEWVALRRPVCLPGVEVYQGVCTTAYPRQIPEEYRVAIVTLGTQNQAQRGDRRIMGPGQVLFVPPGDAVSGSAAEANGYAWSLLSLDVGLTRDATAELGVRVGTLVGFPETIVTDPELAQRFVRLHRLLMRPEEKLGAGANLERDVELTGFLLDAFGRHADGHSPRSTDTDGDDAIRVARDYLHDHYAAAIPLAELVRVSGAANTFSMVRAFTRIVGLPPHAYQNHLRVQRARRLLIQGAAPAEVALAVGFGDQSHLGRRFTPIVGVPPGAYRRTHLGSDAPRV